MRREAIILAALALTSVGALAAPSLASASSGYTISRSEAQWDAKDAAEAKYAANGVDATAARCTPQFVGYDARYTYHRWACRWTGWDGDGRRVFGWLRITGHSNGTYGYLPLYGGLRWA